MLLAIIFLFLSCATEAKPARLDSLPKIVWTYQETVDPNFVHLLCLQRMRSVLEQSRWVLEVLTPTNIFVYLHHHEQYKSMLKKHRKHLQFQEEMEIAKIFILKEYGGIWIDPDIILLQPIDWIHHLASEAGIQTHGNSAYEMVIFHPLNNVPVNMNNFQAKDYGSDNFPIDFGMILALKEASFMVKWVQALSNQLKKDAQFDYFSKDNQMLLISKAIFWKILNSEGSEESSFKSYGIWSISYNGYFDSIKTFATTQNPYVIADFYIKYPYNTITARFGNPNHVISLAQVSDELNEILNPDISRLSYFNNIDVFNFFVPKRLTCAHYLREDSLMGSLLLNNTRFWTQVQNLTLSDQQIQNQCASMFKYEWLWKLPLMIGLTICILVVYLLMRIQWLCVQLLWAKGKAFMRPRLILMFNIFKTVKNVIQYSDNGI